MKPQKVMPEHRGTATHAATMSWVRILCCSSFCGFPPSISPTGTSISVSSTDLGGHAFGVYSHEREDILVRADRGLGALFTWLDGKLVPWREATTHVLTHSLHYGLAVFEGVRAYNTVDGTAILIAWIS